MSDRELLEDAAKAAGMMFDPTVKNKHGLMVVAKDAACQSEQFFWNPLTDNGDALRLMVKLGIDVIQTNIHSPQVHALADAGVRVWEDSSADPLAATRRAIVRAAAEIGRSMK